MQLARIGLFLLIQVFNAGIFYVALNYITVDFTESYLIGKAHLVNQPVFMYSLLIHGMSAPFALLFVSSLVLLRIDKKHLSLHRMIGKIGLVLCFFLVVPSGIGLSFYAMGGPIGKFLFISLSFYTGYAVISGYQTIKAGNIQKHQHWMNELLILLSSAIILRLLITVFSLALDWKGDTMYNTAAFLSWIPWILFVKFLNFRSIKKIRH
ncbi:MAG: DUF2306 domain-containing protein [Fluviicola sp.]|nr:DUF2306 domain-containing protein [Fluviicola sp.]